MTYWNNHPKWRRYAFLSFLFGYRPKWLGRKKRVGTYYEVYVNEETSTDYLVDKESGRIWFRSAKPEEVKKEEPDDN